jgi:hypothetical protein
MGDEIGHRALYIGARAQEAHRPARPGETDVQADVRLAIRAEILERIVERRRERVERVDLRRARAASGQHSDAELDGEPLIARVAPAREHLRGRRVGGRQRVGDERAAAATASREHVAALSQSGQRLAERRAGDAEARAQLALGG